MKTCKDFNIKLCPNCDDNSKINKIMCFTYLSYININENIVRFKNKEDETLAKVYKNICTSEQIFSPLFPQYFKMVVISLFPNCVDLLNKIDLLK